MPNQFPDPGVKHKLSRTARRRADVRHFLAMFKQFEIPLTDEAGWIALKLSCSRSEAEKMVADARKEAKP